MYPVVLISFPMKNLFSLDRCLVYTGSNYRHLVDRTVKSVWLMQVFGLLRVRFRHISLYNQYTTDRCVDDYLKPINSAVKPV